MAIKGVRDPTPKERQQVEALSTETGWSLKLCRWRNRLNPTGEQVDNESRPRDGEQPIRSLTNLSHLE